MAEVRRVLRWVQSKRHIEFHIEEDHFGGAAMQRTLSAGIRTPDIALGSIEPRRHDRFYRWSTTVARVHGEELTRDLAKEGGKTGSFFQEINVSRRNDTLKEFLSQSPVAEAAATVMRSSDARQASS